MSDAPRKRPISINQITTQGGRRIMSPVTPEICDFCGDATPAWDYECEDFALPDDDFGSMGGWAACEQCSEWIESGDWDKIAARATLSYAPGLPKQIAYDRTLRIHAGFVKNRYGERVPHEEGALWERLDSDTR